MSFDFSMVTIEDIIEYFGVIGRKILSFFGIKVNEETVDNLGTMYDDLSNYQPEV